MRIEKNFSSKEKEKIATTFLVSIFLWFLFSLIVEGLLEGIVFFFFSLFFVWWLLGYLKKRNEKKHGEIVSNDIPFFLLSLRIKLLLGKSIETALKELSLRGDSPFYRELKRTVFEYEKMGSSVEEALLGLSERIDSIALKRAVSCIVHLSEQGFSERNLDSLNILARELLSGQKARLRDFSSKIVLFSLMFVVVSVVFPALFLAFIAIGSLFLETGVSAIHAVLISVIVFPLIDIGMMLFIREKSPGIGVWNEY